MSSPSLPSFLSIDIVDLLSNIDPNSVALIWARLRILKSTRNAIHSNLIRERVRRNSRVQQIASCANVVKLLRVLCTPYLKNKTLQWAT